MSNQSPNKSMSPKTYDLFVSYSHQDSSMVDPILKALTRAGLVIFDPLANQEEMWGRDLKTWFAEVFPARAKAAMIFLSKHYSKSGWCKKELDYLLRSGEENPSVVRILPIRLDHAEVPPQATDVVFLDIANTSPNEIAALTKERIKFLEDDVMSDLAILSDEELVTRIGAERDNDAFDVLYQRVYPTILRDIRSHFASSDQEGKREKATDIVGEVLVKLWEQSARFPQQESSFDKWLRYLTNRSIVEHEWKIQRLAGDSRALIIEDSESSPKTLVPPVNPMDVASALEVKERMTHAIEGLSDVEKEILKLQLEGLTYREIAETLDISDAVIRYRVNKLLAKIRYRMKNLEKAS